MQGFNIPVTTFNAWSAAGDTATAQATIFANNDTITGGSLDDLLRSYAGNDSIAGGDGSDTLDGGAGDDTLDGGTGSDSIITNGGSDVIIIGQGQSAPGTPDVITDWSSSDTLRFAHPPATSAEFAEGTAADMASAASFANGLIGSGSANVVAVAVGADVVVFADSAGDNGAADDVVVLSSRTLADVSAANFGAVAAPPVIVTPPHVPTGLALDPGSDSGTKGDGLTDVAQLRVTGVADHGVHVSLYDGTTLVGAGDADATTGAFSFTTTAALKDGAHTLTVQASNSAGVSASSAAIKVTVDTAAPALPTATLNSASDSGTKGDGITDIGAVRFDGVAEKGSTVTLFDGSTAIGTVKANAASGAYTLTLPSSSALADGSHVLHVQASDAAGNLSAMTTTNLVVDTHAEIATIGGFTESTSGTRSTVVLNGTTSGPGTVTVYEDGKSVGSVTPVNGAWSFTETKVTDAIHTFTTKTTDAAGNVGAGDSTLILGGSGANKLTGGATNDFIHGDSGADTMTGGGGHDVFVFDSLNDALAAKTKTGAVDTITDFQSGQDHIDLSQLGHMTFGGQSTVVAAHQLDWYVSGGNTFVVGDVTGDAKPDFIIELTGVHTMAGSDFLFG